MQLLLKWASLVLALAAAFVPLASVAATSLKVEKSGAAPGFHSSGQLRRYLTFHMAEAQPGDWRFEPAAAGDAAAPDRVKWRFKIEPVCRWRSAYLYPRILTIRHSVSIARSRSRRGSI